MLVRLRGFPKMVQCKNATRPAFNPQGPQNNTSGSSRVRDFAQFTYIGASVSGRHAVA